MCDDKNLVIFVLAGRSDIRIIKDGEAWEVDDGYIRSLHEQLLGETLLYEFAQTSFVLKRPKFNGKNEQEPVEPTTITVENCPQQPITLFPGKTFQLAEYLKSEIATSSDCAVVVFNSHRNRPCKFADEEPIAVGPILAEFLGDKLLGIARKDREIKSGQMDFGKAGWFNLLDGEMDLYSSDKQLHPVAIERIEKTIRSFFAEGTHAYLFDGGGFPGVKEPVRELIRLIFGPKHCTFLHVPEDQANVQESEGQTKVQEEDSNSCAISDSYKARQHAIEQIKRGDFQAAYAAASHLKGFSSETSWIHPLKQAANFFSGDPISSEHLPPKLKVLFELEKKHYFVGAAVRTEASLKSGRYIDALLSTFSFFDAALIEGIRGQLCGLPIDTSIPSPEKIPTEKLLPDLLKSNSNVSGRLLFDLKIIKNRQVQTCDMVKYYDVKAPYWQINNAGNGTENWCKWLTVRDEKFDALQKLNIIFQKKSNNAKKKIKDYRNHATHNRLSSADSETVKQELTDNLIWKVEQAAISPFLDCEIIKKIIASFTQENIHNAYTELEIELIQILRNHPNKP